MANKQSINKRRIAEAREAEFHRSQATKRDRRRRLLVGAMVGFLALALIAPLAAGLLQNGDTPSTASAPSSTLPPPDLPWLAPDFAGAAMVGATPCPATDGTAERTTSFESAPPMCIGEDSRYEVNFTVGTQNISIPVDASLSPEAANLAVTFANYRTYEQVDVTTFFEGGLFWIGGSGDTGFTIPGTRSELNDPYPIGSVLLAAGLDGVLDGVIVVVLDETTSAFLANDPRHAVIGHIDDITDLLAVTDGLVTAVTATETS